MDLATFRSELRTRLGVPATDGYFTDAVCNQLVNQAIHWVETEADWPWLETVETINTVNGTESYTPAATWLRTITVKSPNNLPLRRVPITEIDFMTGSGTPRFFCQYQDKLFFRPTPSAAEALTHRYIRTEADLTADGNTPLLPTPYHNAIVELAAHLGFRRANQAQRAADAKAAYDDWLAQMLKRSNRRSDDPGGGEGPDQQ